MTESSSAAHSAANFLLPLAREYRSSDRTKNQRRYLFKLAKWAIREFEPFFIKLKSSKGAKVKAEHLGIDLNDVAWAKRDTIKIDGKKAFHYEHLIEVAAATHEMMLAETSEEIIEILQTQQVAWITIEEMGKLADQDKARRKRKGSKLRDKHNWYATVTAAGIEISD